MGELWRATPAWDVVDRAESALGQPLGHLLLDADANALARTREAQLAVLLTSLMAWEAVRPALDEAPVAFAGHSLGQITALIASGVVTLEDGVRLAAERADCTQAAADARPGRLAALLGATVDQAEAAAAGATSAGRTCWVANDNAPGQVVIGGTPVGVDAASGRARLLGVKRVMLLKVGAAFHTPLMAAAAAHLLDHMADTAFAAPSAPVVANTDAAAHSGADGWPERLSRHLVSPVRWRESLETLAALGARTFLEVGPGNVLSALVRRSLSGVSTRNVASPGDVPILLATSPGGRVMEAGSVHGELLMVPERVILAPAPGRFRPVDDASGSVDGPSSDGTDVVPEQVIGFVDGIGHSTPIRSPFHGRFMGLMASAGERVREGQPVAWLRMAH